MKIILKDIELRNIEKTSSNNDFDLLFHFSNNSHHLVGFRKGEIVEETGYKLFSSGLELKENPIFTK